LAIREEVKPGSTTTKQDKGVYVIESSAVPSDEIRFECPIKDKGFLYVARIVKYGDRYLIQSLDFKGETKY
jgi:hypothetical protein